MIIKELEKSIAQDLFAIKYASDEINENLESIS
jgi:hypothetical protein